MTLLNLEEENEESESLKRIEISLDTLIKEDDSSLSRLPTMWLGFADGRVCVYSSIRNWGKCLFTVKFNDSVVQISYSKGRVFVALANGLIAVYQRNANDGCWNFNNYHLIDIGKSNSSLKCLISVNNGLSLWCGFKNSVLVIDSKSLEITNIFEVHPRKESQIRQMTHQGNGVWISIKLDSTLRLFHSHTHHHLQDIDMEPYVEMMLGSGRLGFSFVRITSVLLASQRLWVGTGNGVIVSIPLSDQHQQHKVLTSGASTNTPGGVVRLYGDAKNESFSSTNLIPYCSMAQSQVSFHGHKDRVVFLLNVPGKIIHNY